MCQDPVGLLCSAVLCIFPFKTVFLRTCVSKQLVRSALTTAARSSYKTAWRPTRVNNGQLRVTRVRIAHPRPVVCVIFLDLVKQGFKAAIRGNRGLQSRHVIVRRVQCRCRLIKFGHTISHKDTGASLCKAVTTRATRKQLSSRVRYIKSSRDVTRALTTRSFVGLGRKRQKLHK